ncbi:MAG: glycosyltransferase [Hungatella hathewayi]|uniref:glycosyltransferase n=1 Tax=Hungatella TaxID=1649459 RepID=UPI001106E427|nr:MULTISPECIES: glycosyltransferase [Hungatella]MCI7380919.1 glycosyltransferase [Hungatella sp.]MDY6236069.1 glycosyltransferase [Hungatella hathewayi]
MKKVSIIIPVYNVEQYLERCLETVVNQSYKGLEIILVDDGSTDSSGKICDKYKELDERIVCIHKENGGLSSARNAGVNIATGEYFVFVDSDDWVSIRMVETLTKALQKNNSDIVCCEFYNVSDSTLAVSDFSSNERKLTKEEAILELINWKIRDYAWNKIYNSALFDGVRFPVGRNYEDMATTYKLFDKANSVYVIPDCLYYYYFRENSIANISNFDKLLKNKYDALISYYERVFYFRDKNSRAFELCCKKYIERAFSFLNFYYGDYRQKNHTDWELETTKGIKEIYALTPNLDLGRGLKLKVKLLNTTNLYKCSEKLYCQTKKMIPSYLMQKISALKCVKSIPEVTSSNTKNVWLIGTPAHDNLGDHAITYATFVICKKQAINCIEIEEEQFLNGIKEYRKIINKDDLILIQGGGNWGNAYRYINNVHDFCLKYFKENKIIIMPQTIYFTKDETGIKSLNRSKVLLSECKDVTFFTRDRESFEFASKEYLSDSCKIKYCPDIVLSLDISEKNNREDCCLVCLRNDKEGKISGKDKTHILTEAEKLFTRVIAIDTCTGIRVSAKERMPALLNVWNKFSNSKLVITDRLHGVIFSYITNTPCVALANFNHKVKSTSTMLSKYGNVEYLEDFSKIDEAINQVLNINDKSYKPFNYNDIEDLLEKWRNN